MNTGAVLSFNFCKSVNLDHIQSSIMLLMSECSMRKSWDESTVRGGFFADRYSEAGRMFLQAE